MVKAISYWHSGLLYSGEKKLYAYDEIFHFDVAQLTPSNASISNASSGLTCPESAETNTVAIYNAMLRFAATKSYKQISMV